MSEFHFSEKNIDTKEFKDSGQDNLDHVDVKMKASDQTPLEKADEIFNKLWSSEYSDENSQLKKFESNDTKDVDFKTYDNGDKNKRISLEEADAIFERLAKGFEEPDKEGRAEDLRLSDEMEDDGKLGEPENSDTSNDVSEDNKEGLSQEEKDKIKEETGWSDDIIDAISSWEEYEIYKNAGLVEAEINGKKCLIRNDIDWNQKDAMGRTNKERIEMGLSPINKDGKVIELHHIGQHKDSPLAELTPEEHRGKGNDAILHEKTKESEIDRQSFNRERTAHWQARAEESEEEK